MLLVDIHTNSEPHRLMSRETDKHSQAYRVRRQRTDLDRQRDEGADIPTDRQTDRQKNR